MADDDVMSAPHRRLSRFSPERRQAIEAESRQWIAICPHCGFERSIWDLGGIRYKAVGTSRSRLSCSQCGKAGMNRIEWRGPPGTSGGASAGFVVKLVLGIVGGTALLLALIFFVVFGLF